MLKKLDNYRKKIKNFIEKNFFTPSWYSIIFNPYFIARWGLYKEIKRYSQGSFTDKGILDVGCGIKPYKSLFKDIKEYVGIDIKGGGHFDKAKSADRYFDGQNIPFENERFDIIICTQVLEHAEYPEKLVAEINRVLKENGESFITIPFVWNEHEIPFDFRRLTRYGLEKLFAPTGLKIDKISPTCGVFGVCGQLISAFIFETLGRNIFLKIVLSIILCFPTQFTFLMLDVLFRNSWITLDYSLVVKKQ